MLSIVNVAYPFAEVGPDAVGGAEQVVAALDAALTRAGHRSIVVGKTGSKVTGQLAAVDVPAGPITDIVRQTVARAYRERIAALLATRAASLIHFHGLDCDTYLPAGGPPRLVTLHLAREFYAPRLFERSDDLSFTCVSDTQRAGFPAELPITVIENGVDLGRLYPNLAPRGNYAACLGRVCPEKGFDVALRAARAGHVRLRVAGQVFPYPDHERYYRTKIQPLLDEHRAFIGPVAGERKRRFLAEAACLIVPSRVDETSSLVTMEALAAGTPVIVSSRGALPSLVEPGRTGFVAPDEEALVNALGRLGEIDRRSCRESAARRFDLERSAAAYLALYERIAHHGPRPTSALPPAESA